MNDEQKTSLVSLAKNAMSKAYVPYSHFSVGAAILTSSGKRYAGCNVENAAYPEGTCAEAGAIAAMILDGENRIDHIFVMGRGDALVTPCGGCRQRIREFSSVNTRIHICDLQGIRHTMTMDELLPFSFGPDNLKNENNF